MERQPDAAQRGAGAVLTGTSTWAPVLAGFGLLESIVLSVKAPAPVSARFIVAFFWTPIVYAAIGAAIGALVGALLVLLQAAGKGKLTAARVRGSMWAFAISLTLGLYWILAINWFYQGHSRRPSAIALDLAVAGLVVALAFFLRRRAGAGMSSRAIWRSSLLLVLFLWLPLYPFVARPIIEGGPRPRRTPAPEQAAPQALGREDSLNLLFIMMDTVRADCLGCYGSAEAETPNIDRLAEESVFFEQAITPEAITCPAVCTMFTGRHPRTHGVDTNSKSLGDGFVTLAEVLRGRGYETAAFIASPVLNAVSGADQGFALYREARAPWWHLRLDSAFRRAYASLTSWPRQLRRFEIRAGKMSELVVRWLRGRPAEPFFAFVHYFDAHSPYDPPAGFDFAARDGLAGVPIPYDHARERDVPGYVIPPDFLRQQWLRYLGEIAYVDENVGRLLRVVRELEIEDRTLVVLVADHGEGFDHGQYFSHGSRVYDSHVHVPLMIRDPRRPGDFRVESQVGLADLYPTVLSLLGASADADVQGEDFSSVVLDGPLGASLDHLPIVCQTDPGDTSRPLDWTSLALRHPPWKYIESPSVGLVELYQLEEDPAEAVNVAAEFPELCREFASRLAEWEATTEKLEIAPTELSRNRREMLRTLGYLK